jgi:hypothetical protein
MKTYPGFLRSTFINPGTVKQTPSLWTRKMQVYVSEEQTRGWLKGLYGKDQPASDETDVVMVLGADQEVPCATNHRRKYRDQHAYRRTFAVVQPAPCM